MTNMKALLILALVAMTSSCGGTPSESDAVHGGIFRVDTIQAADNTSDVDTVTDLCDDGVLELEPRTKKLGEATLSNLAVGESELDPSDIRIEKYFVKYFPLDGGVALTGLEFITSEIIPGGSSASINVEMLPLNTKAEFRNFYVPITQTTNQNFFSYELEYEFVGVNEFDVEVSTKGSTVLTLGDFITCD